MTAATRKQIGYLHGLLSGLNVTDRPEKLRIVSAIIYRPITTTNDLTLDEAKVVIDVLSSIDHRDDPAGYLEQLVATCERVAR